MTSARDKRLERLRKAGRQLEEMTEAINRSEKMKQGKKKPPMPGKGKKPY